MRSPSPQEEPAREPKVAAAFYAISLGYYLLAAFKSPRMWLVVASMLIFTGIWYSVPSVVQQIWPRFYQKFYADAAGRGTWRRDKWVNLAVSMVHSSITTILSTVAIVSVWQQYAKSSDWLQTPQTSLPFIAMAVSNGYCAYDTWDMLRIGMARQAMYLMVHHVLQLTCYHLALEQDIGLWMLTLSMISEINSVFLHLRVLLGMAGHNRANSTAFRFAWWLLFVTMYTARLPLHAYLLVRVLIAKDHWTSSAAWALCVVILIGFNILNFKLNINVSAAYEKALNKANSKRKWAISVLASWIWPLGSLLVGAILYFAP